MHRQLLRVFMSACLILPIVAATALGQDGPSTTPPDSAVVSVDVVNAQPGATVAVPIRLSNNIIDLAGIVMPLRYDGTRLTLQSVDFTGSLLTSNFITGVFSVPESSFVQISYLPDIGQGDIVPISAVSGILATVVFQVKNSAPSGMAFVDSVYESYDYNGTLIETRINFSDPTGVSVYYPLFVEGGVMVGMPTDVNDDNNAGLPTKFDLAQNYPNPFNPTTTIDFSLPKADHVVLEVFNVLGQRVETLLDKNLPAGRYQVEFDASSQPSGIYFYRLAAGQGVSTKKMVLVK